MSKFLHREDAPFSEAVWERIDEVVVAAARSQLSLRRILPVRGPFGLELRDIPSTAQAAEEIEGVAVQSSTANPVVLLSAGFELPARDIAAYEAQPTSLDLGPAAEAAVAVARQEEQVLLQGVKSLGVKGLTNAAGVASLSLSDWGKVGAAATNIISAVTALDGAGFPGPYALALAPDRYNALFRLYPQGSATELEHLKQIVTGGIVKAVSLKSGGLLVAVGEQFASIVLGQDLYTGFVGPAGNVSYEFVVSESIALNLKVPEAVAVLA